MKLTKRRSSPYLPVPSSLWTPESFHLQSPSPTPSIYSTQLGSRSTTSLLPRRIPFRRRGQSDTPLPLRRDYFGSDAENGVEVSTHTHTQSENSSRNDLNGNVFISHDHHSRRPLYSRSISAVDLVMDQSAAEVVDDRKRDSTGQNRYPPNSLAPGSGWGFGRMRKSRKLDLRIVMPERVESLGWKDSSFASLSQPYLSVPTSPNPIYTNTQETTRSNMTELSTSPASPLYPSSPEALRDNVIGGPSSFTRHLSFILNTDPIDDLDMHPPLPLPGSPSSLTRSASLSETVTSGDSSHPLIDSIRRSKSYLAIPKFKTNSNTTPRKLQKRRTGSHDPTQSPSPRLGLSSLRNHLHLQEVKTRKEDQGRTTTPPLPTATEDHSDAEAEADAAWTLARNSSTSTTCSSMIAPSTEESTVLTPPYHAIGENRGSDTWDAIDVPTVSRSSTSSYRSSKSHLDAADRGLSMVDMKQILLEDSTELDAMLARPMVRPQASFLSEDTVMSMSSSQGIDSHSSDQTPSPTSTAQAVDFTASPINNSASPTSPETSNSSPINRIRNGYIRSRTNSIAAMSMNRASDYSIGSIGEIGVANTGSMAAATIVHLTPTDIFRPQVRPGVQRSKSEAAHPYSKALGPFLSKESLYSSSNIPLPTPLKARPKPTPRLSLPLLSIEIAQPDLIEPEKKVFSPSRSLSLGKLWRKISTSRRKSKPSSSADVPRIPKSVSCVDVSISKPSNIMSSPTSSFRLPYDELVIPEVPTPAPRSSSLAAMRLNGPSSISFASVSTVTINGNCPKPIGPRKSSLSTPPSVMISDHSSGAVSYYPRCLTGPSFPRAAEAPSTRTILEGVPLTSTPEITSGLDVDLGQENRPSPPRVARRRPEHRRARFSMDDAEPSPSLEERRKYRQTLVDIQDDVVFHQVLQDLARLEKQEDDEREKSPTESDVHGSEVREEWKPDKGEIRAWFVTRELVQGERRHGRLLARGVATVQAAAESRRDEVPPLPVPGTPDRAQSSTNLPQIPSRTSFLSRRTASRSTNSMSTSTNSSSTHLSPLSINVSPMLRTRPLPSQAPPSPTTSPLELLLERLPRLLALSLTLSSRFEDDPSPFGVAEAFVKMEEEMIREIGLWAGEVGNIVAVGMGEMLDMSVSRGRSRRSISGDAMTDDETQEDRLGFADIIIMPIQRAARYKLLFQEMLTITPTATRSYTTVSQALESAEKLAGECDRRQVFDLHAIRRQSSQAQAKKKGKKRPRSVGVNIDRKDKNWVMGRGVGVEV